MCVTHRWGSIEIQTQLSLKILGIEEQGHISIRPGITVCHQS